MKKLKALWKTLQTPKGLSIALGALLALWLLAGFFAPGVDVVHVRKGTAIDAVTGTVKVIAAKEVVVKTQVEGRLTHLRALGPSGKLPLEQGEAFAQLDTTALDREIALYEAREKALREQIDIGSDNELEIANTRADLNAAESLYKNGQYSRSDLERKRRAVEKLERTWEKERIGLEKDLAEATYELQSRRDKRAKMSLTSPIKGDLCELYAVEGQILPTEIPVAMVRSRELSMEASLAEEDFPGVAVGQAVTLNFTGLAQPFKGRVTALSAYGNPETRRRSVFISLNTPSDLIVPGSTGYATIVKAERKNAFLIPRRALFGDSVYVLSLGHLQRRRVGIGYQSFATVEIVKDLSDWDSVAVAGTQELQDGLRVSARWVQP